MSKQGSGSELVLDAPQLPEGAVVLKNGVLEKRSHGRVKHWSKHYYALTTTHLNDSKDVWDMARLEAVVCDPKTPRELRLEMGANNLRLRAADAAAAADWAAAFQTFIDKHWANAYKPNAANKLLARIKAKGKLKFKDVQQLMGSLNAVVTKKVLEAKFQEFDKDGSGELDWEEFKSLFKELRSVPRQAAAMFAAATGGAPTMSAEQLLEWIRTTQHDENTSALVCQQIIKNFSGGELASESGFCISAFCDFLVDGVANGAFEPRHTEIYQDMSLPLSHYFVSSSHNTYLAGNQLTSDSSVDAIAHALRMGVRVVELDCWDGEKGEPRVLHGHTMTKPILFADCIRTIKDNGFVASRMPLCITLENHCCTAQQLVMTKHLEDILGEILYIPVESATWETWPSPASMQGKIIIRGKAKPKVKHGKKGAADTEDEEALSSSDDDGDSEARKGKKKKEQTPKLAPQLVRLMALRNSHLHAGHASPAIVSTSSINENKLKKIAKELPAFLLDHARQHIVRVYPAATRIDSSNFKPQRAWAHGCQFVALNYQANDESCWVNNGLFRDNGGCGYVLKPPWMLTSSPDKLRHRTSLPRLKLTVELISGHYLPKPNGASKGEVIDPYVKFAVCGDEADEGSKQSKVIDDNGFNPHWNETFQFQLTQPEQAVLLVQVLDKDMMGSDFIGQVLEGGHCPARCPAHCPTPSIHTYAAPSSIAEYSMRCELATCGRDTELCTCTLTTGGRQRTERCSASLR